MMTIGRILFKDGSFLRLVNESANTHYFETELQHCILNLDVAVLQLHTFSASMYTSQAVHMMRHTMCAEDT